MLPALSRVERLGWEVELLGLTPGDHVVGLHDGSFSRELWQGPGPVVRL